MKYIDTKIKGFKLRKTLKEDVDLILSLIKESADYENM